MVQESFQCHPKLRGLNEPNHHPKSLDQYFCPLMQPRSASTAEKIHPDLIYFVATLPTKYTGFSPEVFDLYILAQSRDEGNEASTKVEEHLASLVTFSFATARI